MSFFCRSRLVLSLLVWLVLAFPASPKIISLIEYHRHGARGPVIDYKNHSDWLERWGAGQLTGNGMRMHYSLGKKVKSIYGDIFDDKFSLKDMEALSTEFNRTITSALSHFHGLFDMYSSKKLNLDAKDKKLRPPGFDLDQTEGIKFDTPLPEGFQPIPVFSGMAGRFMRPERDDCPLGLKRATKSKKTFGDKIMATKEAHKILADLRDYYDFKKPEGQKDTIDDLFHMCDYFLEDYYNNLKTNADLDQKLVKRAFKGYSAHAVARFVDQEFRTNILSDLFFKLRRKFKAKIDKKRRSFKYHLWSGHDDIMTAILMHLGVLDQKCILKGFQAGKFDKNCPNCAGLASNWVWELHQNGKDSYSVVTRFANNPVNFCGKKTENKKNFECDWDTFVEAIDQKSNKDYKTWCVQGHLKEKEKTWVWILICCIELVTLLLVLVIIFLQGRKYLQKEESQPNIMGSKIQYEDSEDARLD